MTDPDQVPTLPTLPAPGTSTDSPPDTTTESAPASLIEPPLEASGSALDPSPASAPLDVSGSALPAASVSGPPAAPEHEDGAVRADATTVQPVEDRGAPEPIPGAGVRYAVLRLLLLVTVGGLLALVGMRGWALLFVAVLVSGILSFFIFVRQREAAARNLEAAAAARAARHHPQPQGEGPAA